MRPIEKQAVIRAVALCKEGHSVSDTLRTLQRVYKLQFSKQSLHERYTELKRSSDIDKDARFEAMYRKIPVRSWSGVLVVTIVLRPDKLSCTFDCAYCPDETIKNGAKVDMPRSYLSSEPAVMRAMEVDFDITKQFNSRLDTLKQNGHTIDKLEIIILGGTYSIYPKSYQLESMRDIYYAANTYNDSQKRPRYCLNEEQNINDRYSNLKIIGVSVETRPDMITKQELIRFRHMGVTRVQIGVQHTEEKILKLINRKHDCESSIRAIKLLKDNGFKVDIHIMPDLPGSDLDVDKKMLERIFTTTDFEADYVKIYPCLDITHTKIREWKQQKIWNSYAETNMQGLIELLIHAKVNWIPKHIRINRIQRDFPEESESNKFLGFKSAMHKTNLRQLLDQEMSKRGVSCKCIRCREIKNGSFSITDVKMNVESYFASNGIEFFISIDDCKNDKLLGFLRLRLPIDNKHNTILLPDRPALIRELHVFGFVKSVMSTEGDDHRAVQHMGFGKILIRKAEAIAFCNGFTSIAIISGVGVRSYYRRLGYGLSKSYMVKKLNLYSLLISLVHILKFWIYIYKSRWKKYLW